MNSVTPPDTEARQADSHLEVRDVDVYIEDLHIVRNLSLSVGRGETIGLIGRNGAGKTTTLRGIMGLADVRRGSIDFNGEEISNLDPKYVPKRGIGYQPEDRKLFTGMTVGTNFRTPIWASGKARGVQDEDAAVEEVFNLFTELRGHRDVKVESLSGGQQKMVAIGRALALQPELLLLDEPLEGLAPIIVKDMKEYIQKIKAQGVSVLITDANIGHMVELLDRMYVIERGEVIASGDPNDLKDRKDIQNLMQG